MQDAIRKLLDRTGMSQKELAEKIHVTPQAVSKWARGESWPSTDNILLIFEVTGIDIMRLALNGRYNKGGMEKMNIESPIKKDLTKINNYGMAKQEAEDILYAAGIREKYSYPVYKLCTWLLPAVICLTHHKMLNCVDEEVDYSWIFTYLLQYLDDECMNKSPGFYENQLEYSFFEMGFDLFESSGDYTIPDDEYCREAMDDWYRFKSTLIKDNGNPIYNELLITITEIAELEERWAVPVAG